MVFIGRRRSASIKKIITGLFAIWFIFVLFIFFYGIRRENARNIWNAVSQHLQSSDNANNQVKSFERVLGKGFGVLNKVMLESNTFAAHNPYVKNSKEPITIQDATKNNNVQDGEDANESNDINKDKNVLAMPSASEDAPGEMGKPVILRYMTPKMKKAIDYGWKMHSFNQYVSDMISVHRSLPDQRDPWCKDSGRYLEDLPTTDVIICFHNEAWSTLLRTVHSVIDRSPGHLINKIILVDDFSDMPHTKKQLEDYFAVYPKVKIVCAKKREGLIRARLLGIRHATSPVLTFLDSHCECCEGWLEPLLDRIARNSTTVVCPVIDIINAKTFKYDYFFNKIIKLGGFDWNLEFNWHEVPDRERERHNSLAEPLYSPTMAGGLFSIDRKFFEYLGTYDPGFDIWGSENLELSFKTWMCGGTLEIVPCSHVGHIFRAHTPYEWIPGVNVVKKNAVRLAEVWLDDYAKYYYDRNPDKGDYGDVTERKKLRKQLGCKSFKWYLENIFPELYVPYDAVAHGEIRNLGAGGRTCLDSPADKKHLEEEVGLHSCQKEGGNQYWVLSKDGEIRRDEVCVDYPGDNVILYSCHGLKGNQLWIFENDTQQIRHDYTGKCMAINKKRNKILMENCDRTRLRQKWRLENYDPSKL